MTQYNTGIWSEEEHDRFLEAMELFPQGPWKAITAHVRTRSVRQVQTHAQKYQEKLSRRMRGLRKQKTKLLRAEHRLSSKHRELVMSHRQRTTVSPKAVEDMLNMQQQHPGAYQHQYPHQGQQKPSMTRELPFQYRQPLVPSMTLELPPLVYQPYQQQQQQQQQSSHQAQHPYQHQGHQHQHQHQQANDCAGPSSTSMNSSSSAPQPNSDESLDFLLQTLMPVSNNASSSTSSAIYSVGGSMVEATAEQR